MPNLIITDRNLPGINGNQLIKTIREIDLKIPIIMISRDTIVDAIRLVAANKQVVIAAKYLGKLKTVTQMISVIFLLLNDFPFSIIHLPIGQISVWIACVISIVSGIDYFMDSKDMLTESM